MLELDHLTVSGDVTFGKNVSLKVSVGHCCMNGSVCAAGSWSCCYTGSVEAHLGIKGLAQGLQRPRLNSDPYAGAERRYCYSCFSAWPQCEMSSTNLEKPRPRDCVQNSPDVCPLALQGTCHLASQAGFTATGPFASVWASSFISTCCNKHI